MSLEHFYAKQGSLAHMPMFFFSLDFFLWCRFMMVEAYYVPECPLAAS